MRNNYKLLKLASKFEIKIAQNENETDIKNWIFSASKSVNEALDLGKSTKTWQNERINSIAQDFFKATETGPATKESLNMALGAIGLLKNEANLIKDYYPHESINNNLARAEAYLQEAINSL